MTANRKQKKTTRARAADEGVAYLVARRAETGDGPSARQLAGEVAELLGKRGWPVEAEPNPQFGKWVLYSGPMRVAVTDPGLDPDDDPFAGPDEATLAAAEHIPAGPVWLSAPFLGDPPDVAYAELPAGSSAEQIVAAGTKALTEARAAAVRSTRGRGECVICGERFPVEHLLFPTASEELAACPACVFDGDLTVYYADPPWLAYQLDGLLDTDLAAPATWAAVAAVLATGAAPDVVERLQRAWRAAGTITLPDLRWGEPDAGWLWLPRPEQRPPWQAQLGPCARPGALVTALEAAHPGLREAFVEELHADFLDQIDDDPDEPRYPAPDADTLARGWRAAVSYATALHTDTTDHPERGDPWHALESFDSLHEHLLGLGGESDDILLTAMVHAGITAMSEHGAIPAR